MAKTFKPGSKYLKEYGKSPTRHQSPKIGDIWMADSLPFNDEINSKSRPVLVKSHQGEMILCFKCTSRFSDHRKRYELQDLTEAGLCLPTFLDYKLIPVPRSKLIRHGHLSEEDIQRFGAL